MLIAKDAARGAVEAGEEEQQIVLEIVHGAACNAQRLHGDPMILVETEAGDSAERRDELVLLADRLAQAIDLDMTGELGQFLGLSDPVLVRIQSLQQGSGKTPRGSEAGSRRYVGQRRNFNLWGRKILQFQGSADDRMLDIGDLVYLLQRGVFQKDSRAERPGDGDVNVLVDRGCQQKPLVLLIVRSQIRTAAAERDAQWATRDDHIRMPCRSWPRRPGPQSHRSVPPPGRVRSGCPRRTQSFQRSTNHPPSDIPRSWFPAGPCRAASGTRSAFRPHSCRRVRRPAACRRVRRAPTRRCSSTPCNWRGETPPACSQSSTA